MRRNPSQIVTDNVTYAKTVRVLGMRTNAKSTDLDLPEETLEEVRFFPSDKSLRRILKP